jgi:hypothetical protein
MLETMRAALRLIYVKPERAIGQKLCNGLQAWAWWAFRISERA